MITCQPVLQRFSVALAVCLFLGVAPFAQAEWLYIDDFEFPSTGDPAVGEVFIVSALNPNPWTHTHAGAEVIGGEREATVEVLGQSGSNSAVGVIGQDINNSDGVLQFLTGSDPASKITARYDGVGTAGLGGLDFTMGRENKGFIFDFNMVDTAGEVPLEVDINVTGGGESATLTTLVPTGITPFYHFVPLSDPEWAGFDFTSVDTLEFAFNSAGTREVDFEVDLFAIGNDPKLPEPSTAALLALGFLVFAVQGWRRRK